MVGYPIYFLSKRLLRETVGTIEAGRIGSNYGLLMTRAFKMDLIYFDSRKSKNLKKILIAIMKLLAASSGVSKYQMNKTNLAASCGELTPKEIRCI